MFSNPVFNVFLSALFSKVEKKSLNFITRGWVWDSRHEMSGVGIAESKKISRDISRLYLLENNIFIDETGFFLKIDYKTFFHEDLSSVFLFTGRLFYLIDEKNDFLKILGDSGT